MTGATAGIVLAAGAGTRYGRPKALAREPDGTPWVQRVAGALTDAGCAPVLVALGAAGQEAAPLVPAGVRVVPVADWADGLGVTLRAALAAVADTSAAAALVVPVDVPELPASVCRRLLAHASRTALVRAVYDGEPGHPVLIGRDHWAVLARTAQGDRGAADYLRAHAALTVECADLWHGADVDRPR
ncbi:nucleotidyltransferase family protein [Microbacterium sp. No. 7]|uniref:nucleotidyltransferase family protein n=1 Tax=Microbacterium sp. No. 7 TaxID=1714373 RepID=UPI0006D2C55E|nr:nucleotidyltransferase family protein [Microbacterium sp. No. 7]ALJ22170.1 hypothetical protein AOA12_20705 [Microbacterium sp. No. 7]